MTGQQCCTKSLLVHFMTAYEHKFKFTFQCVQQINSASVLVLASSFTVLLDSYNVSVVEVFFIIV